MTQRDSDITAMIASLEADLPGAGADTRAAIEAQIDSLRRALSLASTARVKFKDRPPISGAALEFFMPEPAVEVPTWISDNALRPHLTEADLRGAAGTRVYSTPHLVACAIPPTLSQVPIWHGLSLGFFSSGGLQSQRFYDQGRLRWAIEYHPTGRRASVGFFADKEPKVHREHGLHTAYSPGGVVCAQIMWAGGVRHGWTKLWEDDGYPVGATLYDQGRAVEQVTRDGTRHFDQRG